MSVVIFVLPSDPESHPELHTRKPRHAKHRSEFPRVMPQLIGLSFVILPPAPWTLHRHRIICVSCAQMLISVPHSACSAGCPTLWSQGLNTYRPRTNLREVWMETKPPPGLWLDWVRRPRFPFGDGL
jgi:hypothetical protein